MVAATLTITMDAVTVGFGLLSSYSSVAAAVEIMAVVADSVDLATVVVETMATVANGSSFFLFSSAAAAEIMVPAANFLQASHLRRLLT